MTGEGVFRETETQSQTFHQILSDTAKLLQIALACLAEMGAMFRPLVRPTKDMVVRFGVRRWVFESEIESLLMVRNTLRFFLIKNGVPSKMLRKAKVDGIFLCCWKCKKIPGLFKHGFEKTSCQLWTTQIEKSGIVTCVPQPLKDGRIVGNYIRIIEGRKIPVHHLQVLGLFQASHAEIQRGLPLPKKNRPGPSEPGE